MAAEFRSVPWGHNRPEAVRKASVAGGNRDREPVRVPEGRRQALAAAVPGTGGKNGAGPPGAGGDWARAQAVAPSQPASNCTIIHRIFMSDSPQRAPPDATATSSILHSIGNSSRQSMEALPCLLESTAQPLSLSFSIQNLRSNTTPGKKFLCITRSGKSGKRGSIKRGPNAEIAGKPALGRIRKEDISMPSL